MWDISEVDLFVMGPEEFIYLIDHATLICTDSYHAAVFSIIFERPFLVYSRGNMNSRIDTLLQMFKLEERKNFKIIEDDILKINFDECQQILESKKDEYKKYIESIIAGA